MTISDEQKELRDQRFAELTRGGIKRVEYGRLHKDGKVGETIAVIFNTEVTIMGRQTDLYVFDDGSSQRHFQGFNDADRFARMRGYTLK